MTTSHTTSELCKPASGTAISPAALSYFRTRNRMHVFSLVQKEFHRIGITQAELALRLGKGADRVCRLLGAPGNWTLDTVSDLLFAISAAEVKYDLAYPLGTQPLPTPDIPAMEPEIKKTLAGVSQALSAAAVGYPDSFSMAASQTNDIVTMFGVAPGLQEPAYANAF